MMKKDEEELKVLAALHLYLNAGKGKHSKVHEKTNGGSEV